MKSAAIVGAGPAGLMAAEMLADAGHHVTVYDAKSSAGRKFLMAGKSGLNLTKDAPFEDFLAAFDQAVPHLQAALESFDNAQVQNWARDLGQEVFTGSTGRVFPKVMKASPLLRAWLLRLASKGVILQTGWKWTGWSDQDLTFLTEQGQQEISADVTVLALGGASWSRLGSDGKWAEILAAKGIAITPFQPANMGFDVDWSSYMKPWFGQPVKQVSLHTAGVTVLGEFVISAYGLEGSAIYAVSKYLRNGSPLTIDLLPDLNDAQILNRLAAQPRKATLANSLRKALRLSDSKLALLQEFGRPLPKGRSLARLIKGLPVTLKHPRPIDEAISVAGGVRFDQMTAGFMLTALPGIFCAGEMLDWEAPTGGYLLSACLATGRHAGLAANTYLSRQALS